MAHLLYDPELFGLFTPLEIYELTIGNDICFGTFLPVKWGISNDMEPKSFVLTAIRGNNVECLKYLHDLGCVWDRIATLEAISCGSLDCLKYLDIEPDSTGKFCTVAAAAGQLDCLIYLCEIGCKRDKFICYAAANSLDCLRYLCEEGYEWSSQICIAIIMSGNLECLQYAFQRQICDSLSINFDVLEMMEILHVAKSYWNRDTVAKFTIQTQIDDVAALYMDIEYICDIAIQYGRLDQLIYLCEQNCQLSNESCTVAAKYGQLECLKYLHQEGYSWNKRACILSAEKGHNDCVEYMLSNDIEPVSYLTAFSNLLQSFINYLKSWSSIYSRS